MTKKEQKQTAPPTKEHLAQSPQDAAPLEAEQALVADETYPDEAWEMEAPEGDDASVDALHAAHAKEEVDGEEALSEEGHADSGGESSQAEAAGEFASEPPEDWDYEERERYLLKEGRASAAATEVMQQFSETPMGNRIGNLLEEWFEERYRVGLPLEPAKAAFLAVAMAELLRPSLQDRKEEGKEVREPAGDRSAFPGKTEDEAMLRFILEHKETHMVHLRGDDGEYSNVSYRIHGGNAKYLICMIDPTVASEYSFSADGGNAKKRRSVNADMPKTIFVVGLEKIARGFLMSEMIQLVDGKHPGASSVTIQEAAKAANKNEAKEGKTMMENLNREDYATLFNMGLEDPSRMLQVAKAHDINIESIMRQYRAHGYVVEGDTFKKAPPSPVYMNEHAPHAVPEKTPQKPREPAGFAEGAVLAGKPSRPIPEPSEDYDDDYLMALEGYAATLSSSGR